LAVNPEVIKEVGSELPTWRLAGIVLISSPYSELVATKQIGIFRILVATHCCESCRSTLRFPLSVIIPILISEPIFLLGNLFD